MPRPVLRRVVVALVGAAVGLVLAILASGPAAAHAVLVGTDPQDGSVVEAPPGELVVTFNEPVHVVPGATTVLTGDGSPVEAAVTAVDETVVITPASPLPDGTYIVSWRVVSLDTHPIAGAFSFSVGAPSETSIETVVSEPTRALVAVRVVDQAVLYTAVLGVAGLVVFELLVLTVPPGGVPALRRRLQRARRAGLVIGTVAVVLAIPSTVAWQAGGGLGELADPGTWATGLGSDSTRAGLLGLAGLAVATAFSPQAVRAPRRGWPAAVAVGGAAVALGSLVLVGHSRTFGPSWLVLAADALHVAAGAVWLGGVIGLALTLTGSAGVDPARSARTVARFSTLGAWLVLALALTGAVLGWRIVGTLAALVTTTYGQTLLVKVGVALGIVAIAAWNRYRLVPAVIAAREGEGAVSAPHDGGARRRLGRTVTTEAVLLGLVLAATGALVSQSPLDAADGTASGPIETTVELGDGTAVVHLAPGRAGENVLELEILDAAGAPVDPVSTPELSASLPDVGLGPLTRPLTEVGAGRYEATLDLPLPGSWVLELGVRTSRYDNPLAQIPLEVAP